MNPISLWPPLPLIESRINGNRDETLSCDTQPTLAGLSDAPGNEAIAPFIRDMLRRREAARLAYASTGLEPGVIVALDGVPDMSVPAAFLLDESLNEDIWSGWLVAPEADYASSWDILLEESDDPFDPDAGLIQLWNPLTLHLPPGCRVLAKLGPPRLAAVRAAAGEFRRTPRLTDAPRPGTIRPRQTGDGHSVLAGTPLGDAGDPRRIYQSLYATLARDIDAGIGAVDSGKSTVLRFPSRPVLNQPARLEARARPRWLPGLAIAATLVLGIGLVTNMALHQKEGAIDPTAMRSGAPAPESRLPGERQIGIVFKPGATEREIRELLNEHDAELVGGPDADGAYRVALNPDLLALRGSTPEKALKAIGLSPIVDKLVPKQ